MAGPPASDLSDDPIGNRDDPVFIDDNESTIGSQDCDQNTSEYHKIGFFQLSRHISININLEALFAVQSCSVFLVKSDISGHILIY